jgi:hypothetical protein
MRLGEENIGHSSRARIFQAADHGVVVPSFYAVS